MAVVIETTLGDITVDLFVDSRPQSSLNFMKLCKMKYYNFNLFHTIQSGFIAQTGDPTGEGSGGESIWGLIHGKEKRYFSCEKMPKIRHTNAGLLSMVCTSEGMIGSQFFFTLAHDLDSLDGVHSVIGEVTEGHDVLRKLNEVICDENHRPYRDVRITHTVILEDPFNDPPSLRAPSRSPSPSAERLVRGRIAPDEEIDETKGKSLDEIREMVAEREAKARATILEIVGDLPDAEIAPPENVLFVCKLNQVTSDEDLEIIFSRFGKIVNCEVIRDKKTGASLQYAFIEFADKKSCEDAYFKMDNVLIDDRRIHVDFSQSVSKVKYLGKGRIKHFNEKDMENTERSRKRSHSRDKANFNKNHSENKSLNKNRDERSKRRSSPRHSNNNNDKSNKDEKSHKDRHYNEKYHREKSNKNEKSHKEKHHNEKTHREKQNEDEKSHKERHYNEKSHKEKSNSEKKDIGREKSDQKSSHRDRSHNEKNHKEGNLEETQKHKLDKKISNKEKGHGESTFSERHHNEVSHKEKPLKEPKNSDTKINKRSIDSRHDEDAEMEKSYKKKKISKENKCNNSENDVQDKKDSRKTENKISRNNDKVKREKDHNDVHKETPEINGIYNESSDNIRRQSEDIETPPKEKKNRKLKKEQIKHKKINANKKNSKVVKKKRKASTSSESSSSTSSSTESSSSSESDHRRKRKRKCRRKRSPSTSSSSSSTSSSSSSSTESSTTSSSSSSSDCRHHKKKRKVLKKKKYTSKNK